MIPCHNCGKMMEDAETVCPHCHAPQQGSEDNKLWQQEIMEQIERQKKEEAGRRKKHPVRKRNLRLYRELPKSILALLVAGGILHIVMCLVIIFLGIWVMTR